MPAASGTARGGRLAKGNKFGTFGGVFTPSILTILGVIMYLRLPWIVGSGGLYLTLGIIAAAHVISVTTGLSVSSIATDKRVEAGGAYYIVSRSMGLAIGGTLGLALFVGLSFSISLYIIGFSESFLDYYGWSQDLNTIRICGSITLAALTAITFASTSLAIRTQYVILALIVGSLVSIFAGSSPGGAPAEPMLMPAENGDAATVLFGIFFPAVTGFTAGVNMSGDLQDPRRSIPVGTILAIAVGMLVYFALAVFLAYRVDPTELVENRSVLLDIAWSPRSVVYGVWGATISSALGSILGAPRILQALSLDHITPRLFGLGHGKTNEPRYALVLAFAIGELGILIGELDAIARIVSVFFIATYGFLNLSASFEMIASPDFRPDFRIPRLVPVIGAATCAIMMVWLDLLAMLGATVAMSLLFVFLKRRELQLETGDAWLGVWSSLVRFALQRLTSDALHQRNWRPNILLFTAGDAKARVSLLDFGHSLIRHRGVLTEVVLEGDGQGRYAVMDAGDAEDVDATELVEDRAGFFTRAVPVAADEYETMAAVCRYHGFSGLEPNTVMLDWHQHAERPEELALFLASLVERDVNVMCVADPEEHHGPGDSIDLWWSARAGSLALNLALVRFFTATDEYRRAKLRFLVLNGDPQATDGLHRRVSDQLGEARFEATVKVIGTAHDDRPESEWVSQYSADTALTVVGVPHEGLLASDLEDLAALVPRLRRVVLVRASTQFESGFGGTRAATVERDQDHARGAERVSLPPVRYPETAELASHAAAFVEAHTDITTEFSDRAYHGATTGYAALLQQLRAAAEEQYAAFEAVLRGAGARRRARTFRKGTEALLQRARTLLAEFEAGSLHRQAASMERGVDQLLLRMETIEEEIPRHMVVTRAREDFELLDDDDAHMRRFKDHRRYLAWLGRRPIRNGVRYGVKPRPLARYYLRYRTLDDARSGLARAAGRSLLDAEELGRFLNVLKESLTTVQRRFRSGALTVEFCVSEHQRVLQHIDGLCGDHAQESERQANRAVVDARALQQGYAHDIDRLNLPRYVRRECRTPRSARDLPAALRELPRRWATTNGLFLSRAALAPAIGTVQCRLDGALFAVCAEIVKGLRGHVQAPLDELQRSLEAFREQVASGDVPERSPAAPAIEDAVDDNPIGEDLSQALQGATAGIPETWTVLREASIQALASDPFADVDAVEVRLRRQLQFVIDSEIVGPVREILAEAPRAQQRAKSVAEDVVRLVAFSLSELDPVDGDGDLSPDGHLLPSVDSGLERLGAERASLEALTGALWERVLERLEHAGDLMDSFAILGTAEAFEAHSHGYRGAGRLSGFGQVTERVATELRSGLVALAYRRSSGLLLARQVSGAGGLRGPAPLVDRVLALVDERTPADEVVSALPFYYRQLFVGQTAVHSAFWVGRARELAEIEVAVQRYDRGHHGAIVVVGPPGAGKSALCDVAVERFGTDRPVHHVFPPAGGASTPGAFRSALEGALRMAGTPSDLLEALPERSVVVLHDAELWWDRHVHGFAVIERVLDLIERHSHRVLFLVELGVHPFRLLCRYAPIAEQALAVVQCGSVDAETLKDIVMQRHSSTGLLLELEGREGDAPSEWALARLFTAHFDASGGNIGAALQGWMANVVSFDGQTVVVRPPPGSDTSVLGELRMGSTALLIQLVLHRQLTLERLARVTGLSTEVLRRELGVLRRMGFVAQRKRDVFEPQAAARYAVVDNLTERNLLP